jgi:hypothetical protein
LKLVISTSSPRRSRSDCAKRTLGRLAPYIHPRLTATAISARPSLREALAQASDQELVECVEEAERLADIADIAEGGLATAKPKGSA